jgi:hypothetical protein
LVLRSVGLRGTVTSSETRSGNSVTGFTAAIAQRALGYMTLYSVSARYHDQLALGFGSAGLEGEASVDAAVGVRAALGRRHGPLLRVGLKASVLGNDALYSSLFELPQLQLGYQSFASPLGFELAGRLGYVLTGRYWAPASRNVLSHTPDLGGHLLLNYRPVFLTADFGFLPIDKPPTADVLTLRSALCGRAAPLLMCVDLLYEREIATGSGSPAVSRYLGLSLLFGRAEQR